jgi:hypothetical protein
MKNFSKVFFLITMLSSCSKSEDILENKNFDKGDWFLANINYVENSIELIDDEQILKQNNNGLRVTTLGECGGTTCDGFLMLYKDGKLIAQDEYLTRIALYESSGIKSAYKKGIQWTIEPKDKNEFEKKWDSLKKAKCYPTIYHTQPADKDIIWVYKIEVK